MDPGHRGQWPRSPGQLPVQLKHSLGGDLGSRKECQYFKIQRKQRWVGSLLPETEQTQNGQVSAKREKRELWSRLPWDGSCLPARQQCTRV